MWGIDTEEQDGQTVAIVAACDDDTVPPIILADPNGLRTRQLLDFLVTLPGGLKTAFAFNYDATMILRSLPFSLLNHLRVTGHVYADEWKVSHIPGKRFYVRNRMTRQGCQVWDVFSWYPTSFARVIEDWDLARGPELEEIQTMKALRSDFANVAFERIVDYCVMECRLLARYVRVLWDLHRSVDLALTSYCGPGSTASAIFRAQGWKPPTRPEVVTAIASAAFYGGRNEISSLGEIDGPLYHYDIGSAYPFEIANLPAIRGWQHATSAPSSDWWGYAHVTWNLPTSTVWGPFPMRGGQTTVGRSLSLLYPRAGSGIYHSSEIDAARAVYGAAIKVHKAWVAIRDDGRPFDWVRDLAARRLAYKDAGDPKAYPLKVGLNSLYGKMVQRVGKAPYRDVVYGAAITAATRARLLSVLADRQHNALLAATDGILLTEPHTGLRLSNALGDWEVQEYATAFLAQSGVYWLDDKIRTRGFRRHSLDQAKVRSTWRKRKTSAEIVYDERRFIGYRLAAARNRPDQVGTWNESQRRLFLTPYPRREPWKWIGNRLLTRPAQLTDWTLRAELDDLLLELEEQDFAFSPFEDVEDPDWHLDD